MAEYLCKLWKINQWNITFPEWYFVEFHSLLLMIHRKNFFFFLFHGIFFLLFFLFVPFPSCRLCFFIHRRIFAKYRIDDNSQGKHEFLYIWLLFFILSLGWIIMLKNGKRESLNSFKSCKIFFFHFYPLAGWLAKL